MYRAFVCLLCISVSYHLFVCLFVCFVLVFAVSFLYMVPFHIRGRFLRSTGISECFWRLGLLTWWSFMHFWNNVVLIFAYDFFHVNAYLEHGECTLQLQWASYQPHTGGYWPGSCNSDICGPWMPEPLGNYQMLLSALIRWTDPGTGKIGFSKSQKFSLYTARRNQIDDAREIPSFESHGQGSSTSAAS